MVTAIEISQFLNEELQINIIEDSSNNGLQVENKVVVTKIGFAVDACQETFVKAVDKGCQMLITHHGLIWGGLNYIKGNIYEKIKYLINNNLALYAVHLPLDLHNIYGNNAQLSKLFNLEELKAFGYYKGKALGFIGKVNLTLEQVKQILLNNNMKTTCLNFGPTEIKKIAIISGGGADETIQAINAGADLFITGESKHYLHHLAKENKINIIFAGHYETEVWGVKALMPLLKEKFNVETEFIDVPTLV